MATIFAVQAREILDSRGYPTVEVDVVLHNGSFGRAAVPSGASTGLHEAYERRDNDTTRYKGHGVLQAVEAVNTEIQQLLRGLNVYEQTHIDQLLLELDGTPKKSRLGANAILGVSLAIAKAAAQSCKFPLYRYLGGSFTRQLPVPLINILNGGMHASNPLDIQEFMIIPISAKTFSHAIQMASEVFHTLKELLEHAGYHTHVGDEGGFTPALTHTEQALTLIMNAIEKAGYQPREDIVLALDAAASTFLHNNTYHLKGEGLQLDSTQMIAYWQRLIKAFPIVSLEDPLAQDDWDAWKDLTQTLGDTIQLVGDDLFVTDTQRLAQGICQGVANAILIKVNQIGTLTETFHAIHEAHRAGYQTILSHRSGETEDTTIADIALAGHSNQIKSGSLSRSERLAKYNQLIRIEEELSTNSLFNPRKTYKKTLESTTLQP